MTPTNKLRFVKREVQVPAPEFGPNFTRGVEVRILKQVRILQQWWEPAFFTEPGEWRDVPVEMEEGK